MLKSAAIMAQHRRRMTKPNSGIVPIIDNSARLFARGGAASTRPLTACDERQATRDGAFSVAAIDDIWRCYQRPTREINRRRALKP